MGDTIQIGEKMNYLLKGFVEELSVLSPDKLVQTMLQQRKENQYSDSEQRSWRNSLYNFIQLLSKNSLHQLYLVAEYQLINKRIDVLLFGESKVSNNIVVTIVELKQWSELLPNIENRVTEVNVKIGDNSEYRVHPIDQTLQYKKQLLNHHSYFQNKNIQVEIIQYLENFIDEKDKLFEGSNSQYLNWREKLFVCGESTKLVDFLSNQYKLNISQDQIELEVDKFLSGEYTIGEVGLSGIKKILEYKDNAIMLEDQREVSAQIHSIFKQRNDKSEDIAIIIKGDPGTGKTIIGLHALHMATKCGFNLERVLLTFAKSRTLLEVLRKESDTDFPYLDAIRTDNYDLIVVDEAHRIPKPLQTIQRLFKKEKPKVVIFLIDDHQRIRIDERGSENNIIKVLDSLQIQYKNYYLSSQKRSGFESNYVRLIKHILFGEELLEERKLDSFGVHFGKDLNSIDEILLEYQDKGNSVKWFAPYCWDWLSDKNPNVNDIEIGETFSKKWNPRFKQYEWYRSTEQDSFNKVGSVYTAQGLDYDYIGFIWWTDLKWDKENERWLFDKSKSKDTSFLASINDYQKQSKNKSDVVFNNILQVFLNQYYVLLTRARKGIYIWFEDKDTEEYVGSFFEQNDNSKE